LLYFVTRKLSSLCVFRAPLVNKAEASAFELPEASASLALDGCR
jgi:hypothetical protein